MDQRLSTSQSWPKVTLEAALRSNAANRPDDIAVIGTAVTLTWAQLDRIADQAGAQIAQTGGAQSRVAWFGRNDYGYLATLIGAWRQRSALVGLNWRLPEDSLAQSCAEVAVTHVFTSTEFADAARRIAPDAHVIVVDHATDNPWPEVSPAATLEPQPEDLAMVFFTSGSTSAPKPVPLTRLAIELGATTPVPHHGFTRQSRLLIVPPVFHLAGSYWSMYAVLNGSVQVYLAEATPGVITAAMADYEITHAVFVPALIQMLVDELKLRPRKFPKFLHMAYGASSITQVLLRQAMEIFDSEFCQVFGMTEAGGVVTTLTPENHVLDGLLAGRLKSAGTCIQGVELEVRDLADGTVLGPRSSGELWFRTPFMAHTYIGRDEASARVFVDGWLNTRDVGWVDEDGFVYVEGRSDEMIITGGENVHPDEIEQVIAQLDLVGEAAVFGVPDERWGQRVCAAVVARNPGLNQQVVIEHCRSQLASYKTPREVIFVQALPRTASGKMVRADLVALVVEGAQNE